jgi:diguanylate cyclase (GGDEF)-like protein/PAS domain S-box-containing protein
MNNVIDPASLLAEIYNSTFDYCIFTMDLDGRICTWNVGAERITGYSAEETIGQDNAIIFLPEDVARDEPRQEMRIAQTTGRAKDYRWHRRKDGSQFWADGVLTLIRDASERPTGYLKIFRDITDKKLAEAELHRIANSDLLTGLHNRYSFETHAAELIAIATRSAQPIAMHLIDLDFFKQVNDKLGHHAGDLLLQQVARRMREVLRESDFIARLGGDEFIVLQPNLPSMRAAADLAAKLNDVLSRPFEIVNHEVRISASIGIAICPQDATDIDQLQKKADLALYRAKEDGRRKFHFSTETLDSVTHKRSSELAALRDALERNEFWIAYQPKVASHKGRTIGMEALLRCSSPAFSGYPTEDIINLALEAGLMKRLGFWILREACAQMRQWNEKGLSNLIMCVNLSAQELSDQETPGYIDALIAEMGLPPKALEIEVTERQALDVEKYGVPILNTLRSRGIKIALDDFGTGYSALSYLRDLPVTGVKLDKSFLVGIPHDIQGCAVIKAVMDLAHALGLEIIAEGVETEEQAAFLKEFNCTALQGFLISQPLSAIEMTTWLEHEVRTVH